jgi:hypothetical protein
MATTEDDYHLGDSQCIFTIQPRTGESNAFDLKVEEDVPAELEAFVRLSHFELFEKARQWFDGCLRDHLAEFPVALEYADMLLRQGSYREVLALHRPETAGLPEGNDIDRLWGLLGHLANMHLGGAASDALKDAIACFNYLSYRRLGQDGHPNALEIHMLELYLEIAVVAYRTSTWPEVNYQYTNPPWWKGYSPAWSGFCNWYAWLRNRGYFWEAQRILSILLPVLPLNNAIGMFMTRYTFDYVVENIDKGSFDETLVLSDLISANNMCSYVLEHCDVLKPSDGRRLEALVKLAGAYLQNSGSLAAILYCVSKRDDEEASPPVLQVKTLEKRLERLKQARLSSEIHSAEVQSTVPSFADPGTTTPSTSGPSYTQGLKDATTQSVWETLAPVKPAPPGFSLYNPSHIRVDVFSHPPTRYACASEKPFLAAPSTTSTAMVQGGQGAVLPRWAKGQTINFAALSNGYPRQELAVIAANALRDAAEDWNQLELGVNFNWVEKLEDASFVLCYAGDNGEILAQAFFPNEEKLSRVNIYSAALKQGTVEYLKDIFLHQLGHVLGFRHDFAPVVDENNGSIQLGPRDPRSVMGFEFPPRIRASDRESAMAFYKLSGTSLGWKDSNEAQSSSSARPRIKDCIAR